MASDTEFVRGVDRLKKRIATIRAATALPPMIEAIGELLRLRTLARFDKEVDPDNKKWRPLKNASLQRRRRKGKNNKGGILHDTGGMRGSIKLIRGSAAGGISTNTGAGIRIGVTDPEQVVKAAAHQRGTATLPVRRFLGVGRLDVKSVDSFMRRKAKQLEGL